MPGTEQKSNQAPTTVTDSRRDLTELVRAPVKILLSTPPVEPERDLTSALTTQLVKVTDSVEAVAKARTGVSQLKRGIGHPDLAENYFNNLVKAEVLLGQAQVFLEEEVKRTSPKDKEAVLKEITDHERLRTVFLESKQREPRRTDRSERIEKTEHIQAAKREVDFLKRLQKLVATEKPLASAAEPKDLDQVQDFSDSAAEVSHAYGLVAKLAGNVRIYHLGRGTRSFGSSAEAFFEKAKTSLDKAKWNMEKGYRALDQDAQPAALVALHGKRLLAEGAVRGLSTLDFDDRFVHTELQTIKAAAMLIVAKEQAEYFQNVPRP